MFIFNPTVIFCKGTKCQKWVIDSSDQGLLMTFFCKIEGTRNQHPYVSWLVSAKSGQMWGLEKKKKKFGRQDLRYLHRYYFTTYLHHISFRISSSSQREYLVGGTYDHDTSYFPTWPRRHRSSPWSSHASGGSSSMPGWPWTVSQLIRWSFGRVFSYFSAPMPPILSHLSACSHVL